MMDKSDVEMKDASEQSQDTNNGVLHPQNESVDVQPLKTDDILDQTTGQDTKPAELEKKENLDGAPETEDMVDAEKNTETELESPKSKETVNGLEMPAENVDQDLRHGEKTEEGQTIKENSELEKTPTEEGQKIKENRELEKAPTEKGAVPVELAVEMASHNETRVSEEVNDKKDEPSGEVVNEKKDEPSDEEVLTSENEGLVDEPKQPEKIVAPKSSLEDRDTEKKNFTQAERVGDDAQNSVEPMVDAPKDPVKGDFLATATADINASLGTSLDDRIPTTPPSMIKCPSTKSGGQSDESYRNTFNEIKMPGNEDGTPQEQAAFIRELEGFYRKRAVDFKAPRFYGQQLNCLKLWRSVIRLGGYDRVTGSKLWRQVGESFHPPKTCTTVSWTFRIFYEKALLEYERHVTEGGELQLPLFAGSDPSAVDNELLQGSTVQASGSGRVRRDSAARAIQGWHSREGGEQMMKDKNGNSVMKREKSIKSIGGSLKHNRPDEVEYPVKAARIEPSKQLVTSVVDVGPPADWVRINIRETKDCYEVYALVPGLLREEVRVQSDPAGRLVITGQPDNPWGITAFKKVVSLPGRIDPLHTSAVVSLHGRLFVRVPFEQ